MAYTADWSDTIIVDHSKLNQVAAGMRATRVAVSERLKNLFYGFVSGETQTSEGVKNLPFTVQTSDPGATADKIKLYSKDVSSKAALFIEDEDANVWQFSQRANDLLSSFSTTVPAGYTDITTTYNNKFMRYSTGAVETTGGADTHTHGAGSYTAASHAHSISTQAANSNGLAGGGAETRTDAHNHGGNTGTSAPAISGTSASGDNVPAYFTAKLYKRS